MQVYKHISKAMYQIYMTTWYSKLKQRFPINISTITKHHCYSLPKRTHSNSKTRFHFDPRDSCTIHIFQTKNSNFFCSNLNRSSIDNLKSSIFSPKQKVKPSKTQNSSSITFLVFSQEPSTWYSNLKHRFPIKISNISTHNMYIQMVTPKFTLIHVISA